MARTLYTWRRINTSKLKGFVLAALLLPLAMAPSAPVSQIALNTYMNRNWLKVIRAADVEVTVPTTQLKRVKVGLIDSGFAPSGSVQHIHFLSSSTSTSREDHGNVVASVIGTRTIHREIGLLPHLSIDAYNIPPWELNDGALAHAITVMSHHHIDILNISLNTPKSTLGLEDAVRSAIDNGMLIVASAGNTGTSLPSYPASYQLPGLISVGSIDAEYNVSAFSTNNAHVTVFAPGQNVQAFDVLTRTVMPYSGTSLSAPFVTVLAFLLKVEHPSWSPIYIESQIVRGATMYMGYWQGHSVGIRLINFAKTLRGGEAK